MTVKNTFVKARVKLNLKTAAESVLSEIGITPTQAITMLYKKIAREHEWPIELKITNEETQRVMDETDKNIGLIECDDVDDFFEKIGVKNHSIKTKLTLLKPPKMFEYYEEVEFQEIIFFSEFFVLRDGYKEKIIAHYWLVEEANKINMNKSSMEKLCYFYMFNRKKIKKITPIITKENFDNLIELAKQNNIPMGMTHEV